MALVLPLTSNLPTQKPVNSLSPKVNAGCVYQLPLVALVHVSLLLPEPLTASVHDTVPVVSVPFSNSILINCSGTLPLR